MRPSDGGLSVAVVGASGFVGRAVIDAVVAAGHQAVALSAMRLMSDATSVAGLVGEANAFDPGAVETLAEKARSADVAINAAGLAAPGARGGPELTGANALLPSVLARVGSTAGWSRLVHLSSAAVYGVGPLDEGADPQPASPYGWSKLIGERALLEVCESRPIVPVILRPTSVHGSGRAITRTLTRFARSPLASVAGPGDRSTPQVGVANVAAAAVFLGTCPEPPAFPVLQPWEGVTTAELLRTLGRREPHHVPIAVANTLLAAARLTGRINPRLGAEARRLEMLWFGQSQSPGWLETSGWTPPTAWPGGLTQCF